MFAGCIYCCVHGERPKTQTYFVYAVGVPLPERRLDQLIRPLALLTQAQALGQQKALQRLACLALLSFMWWEVNDICISVGM